jgi:uroporphyrinogen-III synthase
VTRRAGAGDALARTLAGLGGAPGRPGQVHVVGVPADASQATARALVLLASADVVLTDGPPDDPVLRLAGGATVRTAPVGEAVDPGDRVVVRLVRHVPVDATPGLADEVVALERAGVPFEVEPPVVPSPDVPEVLTAWRDRRPLEGRRVLVPRTRAQASGLSMHVRSLGGTPVEAPTIAIAPGDADRLGAAVRELADGAFEGVCLTSPNGVDALAGAIAAGGLDARVLARAGTVACVGPGTAARLEEVLHVTPDLVPDVSTTEGLAAAFPAGHGRVLLPRADIATNMLADGLRERGHEPVEVAAYRTTRPARFPEAVMDDLASGRIDLLAFASSSTVRNFVAMVGGATWSGRVVSIGPVTSATARDLGVPVAREADPHTLEGLVAALAAEGRALRPR